MSSQLQALKVSQRLLHAARREAGEMRHALQQSVDQQLLSLLRMQLRRARSAVACPTAVGASERCAGSGAAGGDGVDDGRGVHSLLCAHEASLQQHLDEVRQRLCSIGTPLSGDGGTDDDGPGEDVAIAVPRVEVPVTSKADDWGAVDGDEDGDEVDNAEEEHQGGEDEERGREVEERVEEEDAGHEPSGAVTSTEEQRVALEATLAMLEKQIDVAVANEDFDAAEELECQREKLLTSVSTRCTSGARARAMASHGSNE